MIVISGTRVFSLKEKRRNRSLELLASVWSTLAVGKDHDKKSFAQQDRK